MKSPRSSLVGVVLGALVSLVAADLALRRLAPLPPRIMEVDDGVEMLASSNPETLVLGSSHTRSFIPVREALAAERATSPRTRSAEASEGGAASDGGDIALVPVEWGTFTSYRWVLENRLRPLIEEVDPATGAPRRSRLARALLVTTYFDMCATEYVESAPNLPSRAWTLRHFAADVASRGLTDFNRNYLQTRFKDVFRGSLLVQDRGHDRVLGALSSILHPVPPEAEEAARRTQIEGLRKHIEEQYAHCDDAREKVAFEAMIDYLQGRDIEVTVVLFPLMPELVSDRAKETTLKRYADYVAGLARQKPIRIADMTFGVPLDGGDFQRDFDHLTAEGARKFAAWALSHELAFLRDPPERDAITTTQRGERTKGAL